MNRFFETGMRPLSQRDLGWPHEAAKALNIGARLDIRAIHDKPGFHGTQSAVAACPVSVADETSVGSPATQ
ncbi:MAG: hypothetical protein IPG52_02975 [Rhodocyclaceae bacterium]|nr:hypothetical protein [Rhodocyclaceae bacterium]